LLSHQEKKRVEWGDCDPAKIVFYPKYFEWVDAAGHHMLEKAGLHHDYLLEKYKVRGLVLGHVDMNFTSAARFGDTLEIETTVSRIGGASLNISHSIKRDEQLILTGHETRIWAVENSESAMGITSAKIPAEIRKILATSLK
jgi:4-hydroxybenzoyl-CoA thioesterase